MRQRRTRTSLRVGLIARQSGTDGGRKPPQCADRSAVTADLSPLEGIMSIRTHMRLVLREYEISV